MDTDPEKPRLRPRRDRSHSKQKSCVDNERKKTNRFVLETCDQPLRHPKCDFESLTVEDLDCPICIEMVHEPIRLKCNHLLCKECFEKLLELSARRCPICRRWITGARRINDWLDQKLWDFIRNKFLQPPDPPPTATATSEVQIKADRKLARKLSRERFFRRSPYFLRSSVKKN